MPKSIVLHVKRAGVAIGISQCVLRRSHCSATRARVRCLGASADILDADGPNGRQGVVLNLTIRNMLRPRDRKRIGVARGHRGVSSQKGGPPREGDKFLSLGPFLVNLLFCGCGPHA